VHPTDSFDGVKLSRNVVKSKIEGNQQNYLLNQDGISVEVKQNITTSVVFVDMSNLIEIFSL